MYGQPIHSLFSVNHDHCIIRESIYKFYEFEISNVNVVFILSMNRYSKLDTKTSDFLENILLCLTIFHFVSSYPYRRGTICQWCKIRVQYNVSVYRFYKTLQLLNFPGFVFSKKCMLCIKRKAKEMNVKTFDQS